MSTLKTYAGKLANDIVCISSKSFRPEDCVLALDLAPGAFVKHRFYSKAPGFGMLITSGRQPNWRVNLLGDPEDFVMVLWSVEPQNPWNPMSLYMQGTVYAPYVPLQVSKIKLEPDEFKLSGPWYHSHRVNKSLFSSIKIGDIK
jgi:hypothetical protein